MKRGWGRLLTAGLLAVAVWTVGATVADAGLTVPTLSQRSPQWSRDHLGSDSIDTIGSSGCALTAVAMVTNAFGVSTTPASLNHWLTQNGGYIENDLLLWRQAAAASQGTVRWKWLHVPGIVSQLRSDDQDIEDLPPQSLVESELDAGHLVVAEVRLYGGMHFVVITGHSGHTLYINDPWYGDRTTLQARYGQYGRAVHSAQVYYRN